MSKRQILMILGIWIIILPFLGFPGILDRVLMIASGLIIAIVAYALGPQSRSTPPSNVPYAEHKNEPGQMPQ